ncbi:hypothetical protein LT010_18475, partial [Vibrio cholerae]|uniref:hypothetical protein n=1 Tax=Vibrio cholerae TaxID=666 RepID=UPI001E3FF1A7
MRCQPLRRALCLITQNQWFMVFLCSLGWLVLSLSASWLQWALFSGDFFFGAGNSERCLSQFSGKREVRAVGLIRNLLLGFSVLSAKVQSLIFKIISHFSFLFLVFVCELKSS